MGSKLMEIQKEGKRKKEKGKTRMTSKYAATRLAETLECDILRNL